MKIESVRIQKFRSLDDVSISFGQVLAIVGVNNAGKSHVLRALNAFFNFQDEFSGFEHQDHAFSLKSRPKVTVTFKDIKDSDNIPLDYVYADRLTIKFTYRWDRKTPSYEVLKGTETHNINGDAFEALTKNFRYVYVPIIRNSDATFSSEDGIAYSLLHAIVKQQISKRNTLQPLVNNLYKKIESTVFKTAIQKIKRYYPFDDGTEFQLQISNNDPIDSIIHDVTLELIENSQHNDIKNCGSGIQSAIFFAISLATSMDSDISYMVGIEEPELNMHPQAQQKLIESLKDTAKYPNTQFVITTHSTVIIDRLGHQAIALCRKTKGQTRDIVSYISQIGEDFWDKYQITEERYSNFFEYKNSDFFFSDYIIITESTVDCGIITHLLEKSGIRPAELGITFIPANGETSVKYPYAIVKELCIPFFCVVDRDVFQPYVNGERKSSLNDKGLPNYKPELKTSSPICGLLSEEDKQLLLDHLVAGRYEQALLLLDTYSIITMRYAIEVDLLACTSFCNSFYDVLNIRNEDRTPLYLATERSSVIKKLDNICAVLDRNSTRNLPTSYKRIVKKTKELLC